MKPSFNTEFIKNVRVSDLTSDTLVKCIKCDLKDNKGAVIAAINPEKIVLASENPELLSALNSFEYPIADGIGVVMASKKHGGHITDRLTGIDAMFALCGLAEECGCGVFLYGAENGVAIRAAENLTAKFPALIILGTLDGYGNEEEAAETILKSGAKIVFVALGSPKQEFFMLKHRIDGCVMQGVGGSLDVFAGDKKRAPKFIQKIGLEWLYRALKEPRRFLRSRRLIKFMLSDKE